MTARLSRLLPLAAIAAILAGAALTFAATSGVAAGGERDQTLAAEDIAPGECQDGRCGPGDATSAVCADGYPHCEDMIAPGAPDIAPMCIEGVPDCVDTIAPGDAIADCETGTNPCYDTGIAPGEPYPDDRCKQIADDMVACIADPDKPVSSDPLPGDVPAAPPPDGAVSEPFPGDGSAPNHPELAEDIAAREECRRAGACV